MGTFLIRQPQVKLVRDAGEELLPNMGTNLYCLAPRLYMISSSLIYIFITTCPASPSLETEPRPLFLVEEVEAGLPASPGVRRLALTPARPIQPPRNRRGEKAR